MVLVPRSHLKNRDGEGLGMRLMAVSMNHGMLMADHQQYVLLVD